MCNDSTKTSTQNSSQTATTTPNVPSWISDPAQAYAAQVSGLVGGNAQQYVAPASSLQNQAFSGAANLGSSWQDTLQRELGFIGQGANSPTPQYTAQGFSAAPAAAATGYGATGFNPTGYNPTGYGAATIGANSAQIGSTSQATGQNAVATTLASLMQNGGLSTYMNPYQGAVVNSTLGDFDINAGQQQAALAAQGGLNKSFGGSGYSIQAANLSADLARARASTESTLEQQGYDRATTLAGQDANTLTGVSVGNADRTVQNNEFNAGQSNTAAIDQAGLNNSNLQGDRDALNTAAQFGATAGNEAAQFGATAANTAGQFGASAQNTANQFGAQAANTSALDAAGRTDAASQFSAGAQNQASAANQNALLQTIQNYFAVAGLTGNVAGQQQGGAVSDLGAQLAAGATQRGIATDQATAPLTMLQTLQSLMGYNPGQFIGQTINTNGTINGSSTSSPGLLDDLLTLSTASANFGIAAAAAKGG